MALLAAELYEFLKGELDKIMLGFLIVLFIVILLHLEHHDKTSTIIPWMEKSVDMLLGSLITLITGRIYRKTESPK